ncbi:MAG: hypothetical protein WCG47_30085 [Dermatophilaceae bacterium]
MRRPQLTSGDPGARSLDPATVKTYVARTLTKLDARDRAQLAGP